MTALTKLLDFADQLPNNKGIEFLQLLQGYQKEMIAEKTELIEGYERIIRGTQDTPQYEVVAVAGTAEMLLGEINVGDTVECIRDCYSISLNETRLIEQERRLIVEDVFGDVISFTTHYAPYSKGHFRKVSTPLSNPLNTVEGC